MRNIINVAGICCLVGLFLISLYEFIKGKKKTKAIARLGIITICCIGAIWCLIMQME